MPTDSTRTPLFLSVIRLLDARGWTDTQWAAAIGCDVMQIEGVRAGRCWPDDPRMTRLLRELERTKGSKNAGDTSAALDHFWAVITDCETDPACPFDLPLNDGESVAERVLRWTNHGWIESVTSNIHLIPPRRRSAFVDATRTAFNTFAER